MSPSSVGAIVAELVGVVVDAVTRVDDDRREVIAAELVELTARVRRLAPLGQAVADAAARRRAELSDSEDGS
jgi:hypothetical protein